MKREIVISLFALIDIPIRNMWELPNNYWPDTPEYADIRRDNPWWLVKTDRGCVRIGHRKRVTSFEWHDTDIHKEITEDDVTKDEQMVHAYSYRKLIEYMFDWAEAYKQEHAQ